MPKARTDGEQLDTDSELLPRQTLLYRFRRALHKRHPQIVDYPHLPPRLGAWRKRDPEENARTTPPSSEFVDLRCLYAVEFYTPTHTDSLDSSFEKLGWNEGGHTDSSKHPSAWLHSLRERPYSGGWFNLGTVKPPGTDTSVLTGVRTAPLPHAVEYATGELFSISSSLTCIVMGFVFEESYSRQFDDALRKERKTVAERLSRGYQILNPRLQKVDHIRQIRSQISTQAAIWFRENLPGLFSSGVLGGQFPTCELIALREAEPFPARSAQSDPLPEYLYALDLNSNSDAWRTTEVPGLKFALPRSRRRGPKIHSILATREGALGENQLKSWGGTGRSAEIRYLDHLVKGLLSRWAMLPLLEGYTRHLNSIRDSGMFRPGKNRSPVKVLNFLGQHVSYNVDIAAVTAELVPYSRKPSLFDHEVITFLPCDETYDEEGYTLTKGLRSEIRERSQWLQKTDQSIRDQLTQFGSLLGARENIRLQKKLSRLTIVIMLLTLGVFLTSDVGREFTVALLNGIQGL